MRFHEHRRLRILVCALILGLSIPAAKFVFLRISVMSRINPPTWYYIATFTLVCLGSFLGAGLCLCAFNRVVKWRRASLLVSALGSFVLAVAYTFETLPISKLTWWDLFANHFRDSLGTALWLTVVTLPIAALIDYSWSLLEQNLQRNHRTRAADITMLEL